MTSGNVTQNGTSGDLSHIRRLHSTSNSTVIDFTQAREALGCTLTELTQLLWDGELELFEDSLVAYIDRTRPGLRAIEGNQP